MMSTAEISRELAKPDLSKDELTIDIINQMHQIGRHREDPKARTVHGYALPRMLTLRTDDLWYRNRLQEQLEQG